MPAQTAHRLDHLEVEQRALFDALGLEQLVLGAEAGERGDQLGLDALDRLGQRGARRDVVRIGVDLHRVELGRRLAGQRIEFENRFHLVAEQRDAPGAVFIVRGEQIDGVAAGAETAAGKAFVVAPVLQRDEILQAARRG